MEFDTHGLWIDADACNIRDVVPNFDAGVHALSHAMVAVAPIFTSCANSDIDCDHSRFECTRILLYDKRAGGSGATHQLFDHLIDMLEASVDLLEDCISCSLEAKYDGGCPGCIQSVSCDNFQEDLNRAAALSIGKYLLQRLQDGTMNRTSSKNINRSGTGKAKEVLIGRPSWTENRDDFAEVDE
jgi:DEAD/DEAH box helicase domain-containing protein